MSHIFLQKDNITILGDVYDYPINNYDTNNKLIEKIIQKAVMLQIIIIVNGKQKLFRTNFDLEGYSRTLIDGSMGECSGSLKLKDYSSWNTLKEFLETIGYEIDFSITNAIEGTKEDEL